MFRSENPLFIMQQWLRDYCDISYSFNELLIIKELHLMGDFYEESNIPQQIRILKNLRILDLHLSYIQDLPKELFELPNLIKLNLAETKIKNFPHINMPSNLKILFLTHSDLKAIPGDISNLINLEYLNLSFNKLTHLVLEYNNFQVIPSCVFELPQLEYLDLSENNLIIGSEDLRVLQKVIVEY